MKKPMMAAFLAVALTISMIFPAAATTLLGPLAITTAIGSTTTAVKQFQQPGTPVHLTVQANFVYGSSGTSVDAYVQTSFDGGTTWCDIAQFHFLLASARKGFNLNAQTAVTTQATLTDGTLTANTAVDGLIGPLLRVKYTSTGTYAGGTTLQIDVQGARLVPSPNE